MVVGRSALPPPELTNQTALITGGTAGIGLAVAQLLGREGAAVIVSGRDRERGQKAVNDIGGNIRFVQADLADPGSVKSLVLQSGYADIIVNNATSFPAALTVEHRPDHPQRRTVVDVKRAVLPKTVPPPPSALVDTAPGDRRNYPAGLSSKAKNTVARQKGTSRLQEGAHYGR
jgi:NAD(P)-dependent dehydrogenase (short-subunit alcohol dehydrogenase family)